MNPIDEERLLSLAVQRGFLTPEDLETASDALPGEEAERKWGLRIGSCLQSGRITEQVLHQLADQLTPNTATDHVVPPAVSDTPLPGQGWDRYQVLKLLGQGGMGTVYKAFDPRVKRFVALKFLRGENAEQLERFAREAQAQARINHEYVCNIYEVGEVQGSPYISMRYIEGRTLDEHIGRLTIEENAMIVAKAAEAIHAAHRIGIIHRDLKPSNIMIEKSEDGNLHPYVMDFGLARELTATSMTVTGTVMGTPWYMSPEQALGNIKAIDRRSDVYSLGATLYHLLTNRPPFEDSAGMLFVKLAHEVPAQPRKLNPAVPGDLDRIVMKCLEKRPSDRYDSARALAEDLRRFLDGEPILARPTTVFHRLYKAARRHPRTVIPLGVALLVSLMFFGLYVRNRWMTATRIASAQHFGEQIERYERTLKQIYMLPMHDVTAERNMVRKEMSALAEQVRAQMGELGSGPGNYALGRVFLALQNYEDARRHLQSAWDSGYRSPEAAYALGLAYGAIYQQEFQRIERLNSANDRQVEKAKNDREYAAPALRYLKETRGLKVESPEYLEALVAYYQRDYEVALKKTSAAFARTPWLYDARILEGDVYRARTQDDRDVGNLEATEKQAAGAERAYSAAIRMAPSDVRGYSGLCSISALRFYTQFDSMRENMDLLSKKVESDCQAALHVDPDGFDARFVLAYFYSRLSEYDYTSGLDPSEHLRLAEKYCEYVIARQPGNGDAYRIWGSALHTRGSFEMLRGLSQAESSYRSAIQKTSKALDLNPNDVAAYNIQGLAYLDLGGWENNHGSDPLPSYTKAADRYREAMRRSPGQLAPVANLGITTWAIGSYKMYHGLDPGPSFDQAILYLNRAMQMSPKHIFVHRFLLYTYRDLGLYRSMTGQDPQSSFDRAMESFQNAIKLSPENALLYDGVIPVLITRGLIRIRENRSPEDLIRDAREVTTRIILLDSGSASAHFDLADVELLAAREQLRLRRSPSACLQRAEQELKKAVQINPDEATAYVALAETYRLRAEWAILSGQSAAESIRIGLERARKAEVIDARMSSAYVEEALLLMELPGAKNASDADTVLQKAFSINGNLRSESAAEIDRMQSAGVIRRSATSR